MKAAGVFLVASALIAFLLGGNAPFGRVVLAAGFPNLAATLFDDPYWKGVALYRAKEYDAAAQAFRDADAFHNLGNAQTQLGQYAAALESFDRAIFQGDTDARANFDLVAGYYAGMRINPEALVLFPKRENGPAAESSIAKGGARAAGTGDEVTNTDTLLGLAKLESRGRQSVRRVFNDKFMVADERWLEQLSDVPGAFLKARIKHEWKRRAKLGLTPPEPEDLQ